MATVRWHEGQFLKPQHLQWSEQAHDAICRETLKTTSPFSWGVREIELGTSDLEIGYVKVKRLSACLRDGTVLSLSEPFQCFVDELNLRELDSTEKFFKVSCWVSRPNYGWNHPEKVQPEEYGASAPRWQPFVVKDVKDQFPEVPAELEPKDPPDVRIARLYVRLALWTEDNEGNNDEAVLNDPSGEYEEMTIARIARIEQTVLRNDDQFVPPLLCVGRLSPVYKAVRAMQDAFSREIETVRRELTRGEVPLRRQLFHSNLCACRAALDPLVTGDSDQGESGMFDPLYWYAQVSFACRLAMESAQINANHFNPIKIPTYDHVRFGQQVLKLCKDVEGCLPGNELAPEPRGGAVAPR
jgi:predicted component of type VI protein secretion system